MHPDFADMLRSKGFRATPGRVRLLSLLYKQNRPLKVGEIAQYLDLNVVTLYRALEELAGTGLVRKGVEGRTAHFAFARKDHHHHLVCVDCGYAKMCPAC